MSEPALPPTFDALYEQHFGYVVSSLRRLGVQTADLEDVSHELFVTVLQKLGDFDPERPVRPWLFGFAFRVASNYRRRTVQRREVPPDSSRELVSNSLGPDDMLAGTQARDRLAAALDTIDLDQRAVFVLHEIDELGVPEIAETLQIPLNTAYSRLRLARRALERLLEGERSA